MATNQTNKMASDGHTIIQARTGQWKQEMEMLRGQGLRCPPVFTAALLEKYEGDLEKTAHRLRRRQRKMKQRRAQLGQMHQRCGTKGASHWKKDAPQRAMQWKRELQELEACGINRPKLCARLLQQMNGDVDAVAAEVVRRQQQRRETLRNELAPWATQLDELKANNLDFPVAAARLLTKFDGDVEKVATVLKRRMNKDRIPKIVHSKRNTVQTPEPMQTN